MHTSTDRSTVPKMFGIGKVSTLNALWKKPMNRQNALPQVIVVEINTFAAWCYDTKNSVDMACVLNKVYTLTSLKKTGKTG